MNKEALRKLIEEIVDKHKSTERRQSGLPSGRFGSSYYDFTYLNPSNAIEAMEELTTRLAALDDGDDGEGAKRLISMVERRMKKAGIIDILIDRLPEKEYSQLIYNFFESLREIDEPIINGNP